MRFINIIALVLLSLTVSAQDYSRTVNVKFITDQIKLDGVLDDAIWEQSATISLYGSTPSATGRMRTYLE